jgi:hypothetical protein
MFKVLIRVEAIAFIWSFWLCRNDKMLMLKHFLLCRLSTGAVLLRSWPFFSTYGEPRPIYDGICTGGIMISRLDHHHLRGRYNITIFYVSRLFFMLFVP